MFDNGVACVSPEDDGDSDLGAFGPEHFGSSILVILKGMENGNPGDQACAMP
jgi:hypothetical protein